MTCDRQKGMVLLATIMMIMIMTLMILSLTQGVLLSVKQNKQWLVQHKIQSQLEATLMHMDWSHLSCIANEADPNQLIHKLVMHQGCVLTDGANQYEYVLDDLGIHPCLQIALDDAMYASHHWLITLTSASMPNTILQVRVALIAGQVECHQSNTHDINSGVISWRQVYATR